MSTYNPLGSVTYREYLAAKSLVGGVIYEISEHGRKLVMSQEGLLANGISICETIQSEGGRTVEMWKQSSNNIIRAINELNSTFRWEFSELIAVTGRMADSLEELVHISKAPAQTWAYEQYAIARDALRRKLYDDALESTLRAINGFSTHTGYRMDYRFHMLLGTIRLGNMHNTSDKLINIPEAESAFLEAAKYARTDFPSECARALVAAGYAAYCQGNIVDARLRTSEAIKINPKLGEAHFQQGKLNAHSGNIPEAIADLRNAIFCSPFYAIKALDDIDFLKCEEEVLTLLNQLCNQARTAVESTLLEAESQYSYLKKASYGDYHFRQAFSGSKAEESLTKARIAFQGSGYNDYLICAENLKHIRDEIFSIRQEFTIKVLNSISSFRKLRESELWTVRRKGMDRDTITLGKFGSVISLILAFLFDANESMCQFFLITVPITLWIGLALVHIFSKLVRLAKIKSELNRFCRLEREFPAFDRSLDEHDILKTGALRISGSSAEG